MTEPLKWDGDKLDIARIDDTKRASYLKIQDSINQLRYSVIALIDAHNSKITTTEEEQNVLRAWREGKITIHQGIPPAEKYCTCGMKTPSKNINTGVIECMNTGCGLPIKEAKPTSGGIEEVIYKIERPVCASEECEITCPAYSDNEENPCGVRLRTKAIAATLSTFLKEKIDNMPRIAYANKCCQLARKRTLKEVKRELGL